MPISAFTDFVAGDPMDWPDFQTKFAAIRDYLNAVPAADAEHGVIKAEHLKRPVVAGFPVQGFLSGFQDLCDFRYGSGSPYEVALDWGPLPDRVTIVPDACDLGSNREWVTPIGRTFKLDQPTHVTVVLTALCMVHTDGLNAPIPDYPGTTDEEDGGYLEMVVVSRTENDPDPMVETRREVWAKPYIASQLQMVGSTFLLAGEHDVYLRYTRGPFDTNRWHQLDITNIELSVEAL